MQNNNEKDDKVVNLGSARTDKFFDKPSQIDPKNEVPDLPEPIQSQNVSEELNNPTDFEEPGRDDPEVPVSNQSKQTKGLRPRPSRPRKTQQARNILESPRDRTPSEIEDTGNNQKWIENLGRRNGNYMFTLGKPGSGKSTLQSHLIRFLDERGEYSFNSIEPDDLDSDQAQKAREVMLEWREAWNSGRFPESTERSRPSEFRYHVKPHNKRGPEIEFGILEVSGENFEEFKRGLKAHREVLPSLHALLSNKKCKFVFMLVCIGHDTNGDDELFSNFLDYLRESFDDHFLKRSRVAIVISDPKEATKLLAQRRQEVGLSGKLDKGAFIDVFLPATTRRLKDWKFDFGLTQFDVGDIYVNDNDQEYVDPVNFDDARDLFDWVYQVFTGVDPKPSASWLAKIDKLLERISFSTK